MYSTALEQWLPPDSCEVLITSEVKDVILSCQRLLLGNIEPCRVESPNRRLFCLRQSQDSPRLQRKQHGL